LRGLGYELRCMGDRSEGTGERFGVRLRCLGYGLRCTGDGYGRGGWG
jgi:hypothetical protein